MSTPSQKKILITRPQEKAERTAKDIASFGMVGMVAPVLDVRAMAFSMPDLSLYGGLLFTSARAVDIFAKSLPARSFGFSLPVFTVGDQTAEAARKARFSDVRSASGDVTDLVDLVASQTGDAPYLHVRGKHVSAPLHVLLGARGIQAEILTVYETCFVDAFTPEVITAICEGKVQAVMLYSARSAQAFEGLVMAHNLTDAFADIKVLSISEAVLGYVRSIPWGGQYVAKTPDKHSFYALLQRVCAAA